MKIAVIGAGYVGLVSGTCLASVGHDVVIVESDPLRRAAVTAGTPPFHEPGLGDLLAPLLRHGRLTVVGTIEEAIAGSSLSLLAVGTPPAPDGGNDLTAIGAAAGALGHALRTHGGYHVVAVKSTVIPGTTDSVVRAELERASGRRAGDFGLCMNPEFLREGSAVADFLAPDRIVIGQLDARSGAVLEEAYASFDCPKVITSLRNAEMIKYASNALLATLVSFSNEVAAVCEAVPGLDEAMVMTGVHLDRRLAAATGVCSYLRAGIGFGGSCLPKDVEALRALARTRAVATPLLDAVLTVNQARPARVTALLDAALGGLQGRTVAVLGLAFKPGTDDLRDSPALALIETLKAGGATVRGYDPLIERADGVSLSPDAVSALAGADAALLATAWPEFRHLDWHELTRGMRTRLVLDGRGVLAGVPLPPDVTYLRIGVG
jgi:UDPglucose 6-dehydrogenase/GDP-mannose 6-dehydrogenase